ncbi:hypothetical protein [Mycobacterium intracellulare]|uniref:hypothetical protein n=1 Tax=Mycobacterium intracellulare TaxID=1767 RepID=UPI00109E4C6D|nr:hypothetical protein [Mycobacterium intracellulare]
MTSPEIDVEDFIAAYLVAEGLLPAPQISARLEPEPTLPFILVQRVAGDDDYLVDYPTVSVHSFAENQTAASDLARSAHHLMRQLRPKTPVTMPGNIVVTPYGLTKTEQTPIYVAWEPGGGGAVMDRYVARYRINLRLPSITGL